MGGHRPILVTGAFGNLGRRVVTELLTAGHAVVALDVANPTTSAVAAGLPGVATSWTDLTDGGAVAEAISAIRPAGVVHLAAVIPPTAYRRPELARRVNVDGTANLVAALERLPYRTRVVLASSCAVHGAGNSSRPSEPLTADTPVVPADNYGEHKAEAEAIVRASVLDWTILRLGAIVAPELVTAMSGDSMFMERLLPVDGRVHAVDVRDAATAFARAVDADCGGRTLMIAGDGSHRLTQGAFSGELMAASGLRGRGGTGARPGNPDDDAAWFVLEWMDTAEAEAVLGFQRHTWADTVAEIGRVVGWRRRVIRPLASAIMLAMRLTSPYRGRSGTHADPWGLAVERFGPGVLATRQRATAG